MVPTLRQEYLVTFRIKLVTKISLFKLLQMHKLCKFSSQSNLNFRNKILFTKCLVLLRFTANCGKGFQSQASHVCYSCNILQHRGIQGSCVNGRRWTASEKWIQADNKILVLHYALRVRRNKHEIRMS